MKPIYKFKTNIPATVYFESNEPQTGIGQYGEWYRYDVVIHDAQQVIFVSKGLQDKLAQIKDLYGRALEITKSEGEGGRIFWKIKENGIDITPGDYGLRQNQSDVSVEEKIIHSESPLEEKIKILENRLNKASQVFKNLNQRVERTEEEVRHIQEEVLYPEKEEKKQNE